MEETTVKVCYKLHLKRNMPLVAKIAEALMC